MLPPEVIAPVVTGFHGPSRIAANCILKEGYVVSSNEYDWLGDGVYFFLDAPIRASELAKARYGDEFAVVESRIQLADCMDLLDIKWASILSDAYNQFIGRVKKLNVPVPRQTEGAHRLDREVINYCIGLLKENGILIKCVRAAFSECRPVFPNSALFDRAHVQIAVRDLSIIKNICIPSQSQEVRECWISQESRV